MILGFAASKLLGFLPFGNLLSGGTGKLLLIVGLLVGALFIYWKWKDNIESAVYDRIFREQVEGMLEERDRQIADLQAINEQRSAILRDLLDRQDQIDAQTGTVEEIIRSDEFEDGELSPGTLDVLRALRALDVPVETPEPTTETTGNSAIDAYLEEQVNE